jgi:hypothetical protein
MRHTSARTGRLREAGTTSGFVHSHALKTNNQILIISIHMPESIAMFSGGDERVNFAPA